MKKLISWALVLMLAFTCVPAIAAQDVKLPFELKAPENVALSRINCEGDSPTTHCFAYSIDSGIQDFFIGLTNSENGETYLKPYGLSDAYIIVQVDWAIDDVSDSVSGWHANDYWKLNDDYGFGCDNEGRTRTSEWDVVDSGFNVNQTVNEIWILRSVPDDFRWNGVEETKTPGVKDQLNPDQYDYHDDDVWIDWNEHTAYARARFVVVGMPLGSDRFTALEYSDWSDTAACGKDAEKVEPVTALPAPTISDLHMTDKEFNDNPIVAFTLTVPDELAKLATAVSSAGGGIAIETFARVKGDTEWTEMGNTDSNITSGELECALLHLVNDERPHISKDTEIELRCRYRCSQAEVEEDVFSDYSDIISFNTTDISTGNASGANASAKPDSASEQAKDKCSICHFCPRPLGLCIFIWLAIILAVIILIVIIAKSGKNKKNK